jgi:hypothetical protein
LLRRPQFACRLLLTFPNHVHEFDTVESDRSRPERFEPQHWSHHPFDDAMVLLDDVVEIFYLTAGWSKSE